MAAAEEKDVLRLTAMSLLDRAGEGGSACHHESLTACDVLWLMKKSMSSGSITTATQCLTCLQMTTMLMTTVSVLLACSLAALLSVQHQQQSTGNNDDELGREGEGTHASALLVLKQTGMIEKQVTSEERPPSSRREQGHNEGQTCVEYVMVTNRVLCLCCSSYVIAWSCLPGARDVCAFCGPAIDHATEAAVLTPPRRLSSFRQVCVLPTKLT